MAPLTGDNLAIEVETAPTVFTALGNGTSYDSNRSNSRTSTPVFGGARRYSDSSGETTYACTVLADPDDEAQLALLAAERAKTVINIHVMPDGASGFKAGVRVTSSRHSASAEPGFQTIAFEMAQETDPVADPTTGFIL